MTTGKASQGFETIARGIAHALQRHWQQPVVIAGLVRLTGGASSQTYAFDATRADGQIHNLILRRDPFADADPAAPSSAVSEARLIAS